MWVNNDSVSRKVARPLKPIKKVKTNDLLFSLVPNNLLNDFKMARPITLKRKKKYIQNKKSNIISCFF